MNQICKFPNLDGKKVLFLAETNFQFINCINIANNMKNSKCDLYINNLYKNTIRVAKLLNELEIFQKVQVYSVNVNKVLKVVRFIKIKETLYKIFGNFDYDVVFFASRDFITRCVITYIKYYNPSISLIAYDEGLGTYISKMETYTNVIEKIIIKLFYNDNAAIITDKMLYKPDAYVGDSDGINLYEMPQIDEKIIQQINFLFDYNDNYRISSKYIYFDEYYDGSDEKRRRVMNILLNKTKGQLIIKKHPQTAEGMYAIGNEYKYSNLPFEVIAANDDDIENKVLITNMSSAVWTPMLLFHKYPKIVLLSPLFNAKEVKDIINKFISSYDKDKIIIVKNFEELEQLSFY